MALKPVLPGQFVQMHASNGGSGPTYNRPSGDSVMVDAAVDTMMQGVGAGGIRSAISAASGSGSATGTNTGDQTSVTGNAGTATKLAASVNIDATPFDGSANVTLVAPAIHAATSKSTPVDADETSLVDSAASNILKKLTWANLKATLKTYFDTLYQAAGGGGGGVVIAAKSVTKTDTTSTTTTNGTWTDIGSLTITYTPTSASNNIRVRAVVCIGALTSFGGAIRAVMDGSMIQPPGAPASPGFQAHGGVTISANGDTVQTAALEITASPGDTNSHVFKIQFCGIGSSSTTTYVNRTPNDASASYNARYVSTLTIEEVVP